MTLWCVMKTVGLTLWTILLLAMAAGYVSDARLTFIPTNALVCTVASSAADSATTPTQALPQLDGPWRVSVVMFRSDTQRCLILPTESVKDDNSPAPSKKSPSRRKRRNLSEPGSVVFLSRLLANENCEPLQSGSIPCEPVANQIVSFLPPSKWLTSGTLLKPPTKEQSDALLARLSEEFGREPL